MNERRWLTQGVPDPLRSVLASAEEDDARARAQRGRLQSRMLSMGIAVAPPALAPVAPAVSSAPSAHTGLRHVSAGTSAPIAGQSATITSAAAGAAPFGLLGAKLWIGVVLCAAGVSTGAWVAQDASREPPGASVAHRNATVDALRSRQAQASDLRNVPAQAGPTAGMRSPGVPRSAAKAAPSRVEGAQSQQTSALPASAASVVAELAPGASDRPAGAAAPARSQRARGQSAARTETGAVRAAVPIELPASQSRSDVAPTELHAAPDEPPALAASEAPLTKDLQPMLRHDVPAVLDAPIVLTLPAADWRLREEVALLEAMQRQLPRMPRRALELAREHTRAFPHGALAAERELLRLQALVATRQWKDAALVARQMAARYPSSIYARRAQRLIAAARALQ